MEPDWEYAQTFASADFDDHAEPAPPAGEGWERDPSAGCPTCGGCGFTLDGAEERDICGGCFGTGGTERAHVAHWRRRI